MAEYLEETGPEGDDLIEEETESQPLDFSDREDGDGYNLMSEAAMTALHESHSEHEPFGHKIGDLCPECGQAAVVNEEGCRKCYACGFSEC